MDWRDSYRDAEDSDEDDPFPKMLESDADSILGPYVATELSTVEKVNAPRPALSMGMSLDQRMCDWTLQEVNRCCRHCRLLAQGLATALWTLDQGMAASV